MDYTLKFTSEAKATAVLYADDKPLYPNIDTIGLIYKATGKTTLVDGVEMPVMKALKGWHVNVRCDEAPELDAYAVTAITPTRVWA